MNLTVHPSDFQIIIKFAFSILSDTPCPNQCNFQMFRLYKDEIYSLRRIDLTIGDDHKIKSFIPCLESDDDRNLYINCASWNESKSQIFIYIYQVIPFISYENYS